MENEFKSRYNKTSSIYYFQSQKLKEKSPGLILSNNKANLIALHKQLCVILDSKLSFDEHLKLVLSKISKMLVYLENWNISSLEHA